MEDKFAKLENQNAKNVRFVIYVLKKIKTYKLKLC